MKQAQQWRDELRGLAVPERFELVEGRQGDPTLRIDKVFLHSRYKPVEEAQRLIESADLDLDRPVLVVGLGLGYHVVELLERGARNVVVLEENRAVVKLALDSVLSETNVPIAVGTVTEVLEDTDFRAFMGDIPQILVHPPTAKISPDFAREATSRVPMCTLAGLRLRVAVVGPMYGGSLPIARFLTRGFEKAGHRALFVDNSTCWPVYYEVKEGVRTGHAADQLSTMLTTFMNEWSYARVAEFMPDICIVMAQAPVARSFAARLAKHGIVTAFWFVENWRHFGYWTDVAPCYDYFFHIQPGEFDDKLEEIGCVNHCMVQTAADPEAHRAVSLTSEDAREYGCDISFAGAGYYNRLEVFKGLTDYDFKIWGVNWPGRELAPLLQRGEERFDAERFNKIVAGSKISLNLHSSSYYDGVDPRCDAVNPRVFEIAACGGFQLCDPCRNLDHFFDFDTELPVYRNLGQLRERIDYFLANREERQAFARRARERVLRDHTYEKRAQQMLDLLIERHGERIVRKGVRVQKTFSEMAERVGSETELGRFFAGLPANELCTHENVNQHLEPAGKEVSHAEGVFMYLREMRHFAEDLFENMR